MNDVDLHCPLKAEYRKREAALMLEKLRANKDKIPKPEREEMITMLMESKAAVSLDIDKAFKSLFLTNAFDGTEDVLVKDELLRMVHNEIKAFRDELKEWTLPDSVHGLMKQILPPKGIKRNFEGMELFDCDGPGEVTDQYFNISFFLKKE